MPLIAKVHGAAYGGGVGLACVCDYVISSSNVKFGFTETRLGLIPSTIGPYVVGKMGQAKLVKYLCQAIFSVSWMQKVEHSI